MTLDTTFTGSSLLMVGSTPCTSLRMWYPDSQDFGDGCDSKVAIWMLKVRHTGKGSLRDPMGLRDEWRSRTSGSKSADEPRTNSLCG